LSTDWYSIACFVILFINVLKSALRGFSKEFLVLCGVVAGLFVGMRYAGSLAFFLQNITGWDSPWLVPVGFLLLFIPLVLIFSWAGMFFRRLFQGLDIVWFDAILGFLVGILKGMLWIVIVTVFILNVSFLQFLTLGIAESGFYRSFTRPAIEYIAEWLVSYPETSFLQDILQKGVVSEEEDVEDFFDQELESEFETENGPFTTYFEEF